MSAVTTTTATTARRAARGARPRWVGGGAVLAVALLAGCSAGSSTLAATSVAAQGAPSPSAAASSAAPSPSGAVTPSASSAGSVPAAPRRLPAVRPNGTIDGVKLAEATVAASRAAGSAHVVTRKSGAGAGGGEGDLTYTAQGVSVRMEMEIQGSPAAMLVLPGEYYLAMDGAPLPAGKKWIKIDPKGGDEISTTLGPLFSALDPKAMGAVSRDVMKGVTVTAGARKTVGGTTVTPFSFTVAGANVSSMVERMLAGLPAEQRKAVRGIVAKMSVKQTLLVDDTGLVWRDESTVTIPGQKAQTTVTEYSKWGQKVTIEAPPAAEVIAAADVE